MKESVCLERVSFDATVTAKSCLMESKSERTHLIYSDRKRKMRSQDSTKVRVIEKNLLVVDLTRSSRTPPSSVLE